MNYQTENGVNDITDLIGALELAGTKSLDDAVLEGTVHAGPGPTSLMANCYATKGMCAPTVICGPHIDDGALSGAS